ncbi:LAME_0E12398g1_1 [Lachancea meyersii CBS 8951]|uniref:Nuclear pore complex protein Nup85 n=1 Tax=Lachancea meyersii CBS 8951 TaxID=1266667 RepID=A0A1G4JM29_9SACH|nr:LAME_0E12398g1_1 [Lachancea meyersii CBS 8951]
MSSVSWSQDNGFLMDVGSLNFLKSSSLDVDMDNYQIAEESSIDEVSGALQTFFEGFGPLGGSGESFVRPKRGLKFQMAPVRARSLGYYKCIGDKEAGNGDQKDVRLLTPNFHGMDSSEAYKQFVLTCFEIYKNLGEDRFFSIPTLGLVSQSAQIEHSQAVNLAMDALLDELETFALTQSLGRASELEECIAVLNCVKALYFTSYPQDQELENGSLVQNVAHWINRADGEPSERVIEQVFSGNNDIKVYEKSSLWKLVNQLLLRGLFEQALAVLERSGIFSALESQCEVTFNVLTDATSLLKEYPYSDGVSFREWKATALNLSQFFSECATNLGSDLRDFINDMLHLISGTQAKIIQYSNTWFESFCGLLTFYIPTIGLSEEYLQLSLDAHPADVCNAWEQACVDVIRGKVYAVLPMLESQDYCVAAFFAGICEAKGLLESSNSLLNHSKKYDDSIEEDLFSSKNSMASFLLHGFAMELCSYDDKHLWSVAIGTLALSPSGSSSAVRLAIAELLPHFPFENNDDVEWMLTLCAKWRLPEVAKTIYRILGNKFLYENNVIEAMTNFSKAGEYEWVKHYSWMIFEASVIQGSPLEDEVIDAIVSRRAEVEIPREILANVLTDAMRQTLSPYAVLCQFYRQAGQQDWDRALQSLLILFEFPYLPSHYLALLMAKFLYPVFLQNDSKQISEDKIIRIIRALNNFESDNDKSVALYEVLKEREDSDLLPTDLDGLIKLVRKRLNFKVCQEFMN